MTRVAVVKHAPEEGPGAIADWAARAGVTIVEVRAERDAGSEVGQVDGVVLLGGPHRATGGEAWLAAERDWVTDLLARGAPIFGVCLGAQLIATCSGAAVRPRWREAGWIDVELLEPGPTRVRALSWHDDGFDLPAGATRIARSVGCPEQGFRLRERVVGLQFHAEWTLEILRGLRAAHGEAMPAALSAPGDHAAAHLWLGEQLDRWVRSFGTA